MDENLRKYAEYYHFKPEKNDFERLNYNVSTSHVEFLENGNVLYISHTLIDVYKRQVLYRSLMGA